MSGGSSLIFISFSNKPFLVSDIFNLTVKIHKINQGLSSPSFTLNFPIVKHVLGIVWKIIVLAPISPTRDSNY